MKKHRKRKIVRGKYDFKVASDKFEKNFLLTVLHHFNWRQTDTAKAMNLHRNAILYKVHKYRLSKFIKKKRKFYSKNKYNEKY